MCAAHMALPGYLGLCSLLLDRNKRREEGGLTRFLPPLQQIGQCGCGKKRQVLLN